MSGRKMMHDILGEAIACTERGDKNSVDALRDLYSEISLEVYSEPLLELDVLYDRCMSDCVLYFIPIHREKRDQLIQEAKNIYSKLPVPGDDG